MAKIFLQHIVPHRLISLRISDEALLVKIKAAHAASKGEYGWPRIWQELRASGVRVWKERIRRLIQQHGCQSPREK